MIKIPKHVHPLYWVKYHLHKDGSEVQDGFYSEHDCIIGIAKLKKQGYYPVKIKESS